MLKKTKNNLEWLEFEQLQPFPHLRHAIFTREGGVSAGPFASLNVAYNVGDDPQSVAENRAKIKNIFTPNVPLITCQQTHCADIAQVTQKEKDHEEPLVDGLLTNQKNLLLTVRHADCQAAIFFDPVTNTLACVHAGWKGLTSGIYGKTVAMMQKRYKSRPEDILVSISPSIGPLVEFKNYEKELPQELWHFQEKPTYFNLWAIAQQKLLDAGIAPSHIEIAQIDTVTNPSLFFSYRREKVCGRNATCCMLT